MTLSSGAFQPAGFERYVPVMAAEQRGELQFAVPYVGQYHDCSVVVVLVEHPSGGLLHAPCTLTIAGQAVTVAGGGADQAKRYRFVVTPPIPDEQATRLAMTFPGHAVHVFETGNARTFSARPVRTLRARGGYAATQRPAGHRSVSVPIR